MPGTQSVDIPAYTDTALTVSGEPNLLPENIRQGVSIFDIVGTMSEGLKADYGTVVLAESNGVAVTNVRINHNLGVIPTKVYLFPNSDKLKARKGEIYNGLTCLLYTSQVILRKFRNYVDLIFQWMKK